MVIGDSISADPFSTDLGVVPWTRRLATRLRGSHVYSYAYARGVPSRAFSDWSAALLYAAVHEHNATDALVYLVTNDLLNLGTIDLATLQTRANTVFDYLASLGVEVHALSGAPCGLAADDPDELTRQDYVPWLLGGGAASVKLAIDIDSLLRDPANHSLLAAAYDHGDGVHLNNAGHLVVGNAVADALELP